MTGLATGPLSGSHEQGISAVAPGQWTRGVEYKEWRRRWQTAMVGVQEFMGGCYGVAGERRCPAGVSLHMFLQFTI